MSDLPAPPALLSTSPSHQHHYRLRALRGPSAWAQGLSLCGPFPSGDGPARPQDSSFRNELSGLSVVASLSVLEQSATFLTYV